MVTFLVNLVSNASPHPPPPHTEPKQHSWRLIYICSLKMLPTTDTIVELLDNRLKSLIFHVSKSKLWIRTTYLGTRS